MYGTLARMKVSRENMDELRETMTPPDRTIEGQRATYVVVPDHWKDEVWLLAVFDDKATYDKNAASPGAARGVQEVPGPPRRRAEWIDGQIEVYEP